MCIMPFRSCPVHLPSPIILSAAHFALQKLPGISLKHTVLFYASVPLPMLSSLSRMAFDFTSMFKLPESLFWCSSGGTRVPRVLYTYLYYSTYCIMLISSASMSLSLFGRWDSWQTSSGTILFASLIHSKVSDTFRCSISILQFLEIDRSFASWLIFSTSASILTFLML